MVYRKFRWKVFRLQHWTVFVSNSLNVLNNNSEFRESNDLSMPNSESESSSGQTDASDFSSASAITKLRNVRRMTIILNLLQKKLKHKMGVKTRSYTSRTNGPIDKSLKVLNSSLPSHSKTTSTAVVESIEYAANCNSSYISMVESINDEETPVCPNCDSVPKVDSTVANSKAY